MQTKPVGVEKGDTEKSVTDRHRERRLKKKQKRLKISEKRLRDKLVKKLRPGLGNKYSKRTLSRKLGGRERETVDRSLQSSSKFFARLQQEVQEEVKAWKREGKRYQTAAGQKYKL